MTDTIAMRRTDGRTAQPGFRRGILRTGTAMMAVLAASAAHAQCTNPTASSSGSFQNFNFGNSLLPTSSVVSGVQSLVSVLTTQNTAFLTQTSGFIGAPANPPAEIQGGGAWVRGIGGTFDTNTPGNYSTFPNAPNVIGPGQSGSCNVRTFQDYAGFQTGADISRLNINGFNIHGGVTMGYTESSIRTNGSFRADFQTPFVGIYGAITKGGFFADGQVRWDFFQGLLNDPSNTLTNQRLDARSLSLTGNVGYQIPFDDGFFVEPSAGAVYAQVKVDRLQTGGLFFVQAANNPNTLLTLPNTTKISDFDSILARASIRVGKNFIVDGYALQPFFTATVINEFGAPVRSIVSTNFDAFGTALGAPGALAPFDQAARLNTYRIGTYGQFSVGIAGQILNTGWLGYVRGDYRTGDRVEGYGISGGLRYQFNPETAARALITKGDAPIIAPLEGPVNWTGFSIGASAGGLWSQTRQVTDPLVDLFVPGPLNRADPHAAGVYAGGQVGVDYQFDRIVVGVAGDGGWTNARGGSGCNAGFGGNVYSCQTNIDDLYMATARVGYAMERSLFYVKGGGAFAHTVDRKVDNFANQQLIFGFSLTNSTVRDFAAGWTGGGGFEFAITKNISAKAEYMHFELDRKNYLRGTPTNLAIASAEHVGDIVKVGVNYRFTFEPPVVAPPPRAVIAKY